MRRTWLGIVVAAGLVVGSAANAEQGPYIYRIAGGGPPDGVMPTAWETSGLGVEVGPDGTIYYTDETQSAVRSISPAGEMTTLAGRNVGWCDWISGNHASDSAPGRETSLCRPNDVELGPDGHLYIADTYNDRIRRMDPQTGRLRPTWGPSTPGLRSCHSIVS